MQWLFAQNKQCKDSVWPQEEQTPPLLSHQNTPQFLISTIIIFSSLALVEICLPQLFLQLPRLQHHSLKTTPVIPRPWHMRSVIYPASASFLMTSSGSHLTHSLKHLHYAFLPSQDYHNWAVRIPTSHLLNLQVTHYPALDLQVSPAGSPYLISPASSNISPSSNVN